MLRLSRVQPAAQHDHRLIPAQWETLRYLSRANRYSRSPSTVAAFLGTTKGTASQTLLALERKGLIHREPDPKDRRSGNYTLTDLGLGLLVDDPIAALTMKADALRSTLRLQLAGDLRGLLRELQLANGGRAFGECATCRHFRRDAAAGDTAGPHRCGLTNEALTDDESRRISAEREAVAALRSTRIMVSIKEFLRLESAAGLVLVVAAVFAFVLSNSGLAPYYDSLLDLPVSVHVGALGIAKPLLLCINDGLMAIFFLLVGLEFKREVYEGELSSGAQIALPLGAAIGGMAVPAAVFVAMNAGDPTGLRGWAIPSATDIAFTLAVAALLGSRVPVAIKVFLTAVAIIDDVGAVVIIAIFYTADLSVTSLALAGAGLIALLVLNLAGVTRRAPYILVGVFVWVCVLKSGVHATLAGVALGLAIPLRTKGGDVEASPLRQLEHTLHPWAAFAIVPIFGFANAGVAFSGIGLADVVAPIPLGIALGLFLGKPLGVLAGSWLVIRAGIARRPDDVSWPMLVGAATLCGIGFTMSLFIGTLAYEHAVTPPGALDFSAATRLGVLLGSLMSALVGLTLLARACRPTRRASESLS